MEGKSLKILKLFIIFIRNFLSVLNSPYVAFRKISFDKEIYQSIFIFLLVIIYFAFASLVRVGIHNPYLLTLQFNRLVTFSIIGILFFTFLTYKVGVLVGGKGSFKQVFLCFSYTLIPTLLWFTTTSFIFILLPPPRTLSIQGKFFSFLFVAFSILVLLWKAVLYYLTLRFSLKLDLLKILYVSSVTVLCVIAYGFLMYKIGVFRIPFI